MIMIRVSIILLLCIGLLPELSRSSSTSVARNDVKYRVSQSGYDGVSETFFLQISVSEQDITRQRLERLVCELKLRYSKYSRLSVANSLRIRRPKSPISLTSRKDIQT